MTGQDTKFHWQTLALVAIAVGLNGCAEMGDLELDEDFDDTVDVNRSEEALMGEVEFGGTEYCSPSDRYLTRRIMEYGRIAATSAAFRECLEDALETGVDIGADLNGETIHEIGPYLECTSDQFHGKGIDYQREHLFDVLDSPNPIRINDCHASGTGSAAAAIGTYELEGTEHFSWRFWLRHNERRWYEPPCQGNDNFNGGRCRGDENYITDQPDSWILGLGAATVWHEAMHQHGYIHEENPATCGNTSNNTYNFQFNTIPYIVNQCMEHVFRRSIIQCHDTDYNEEIDWNLERPDVCDPGELYLVDSIYGSSCSCHSDATLGPIFAYQSGRCLETSSSNIGATVQQFQCNYEGDQQENQQWIFREVAPDTNVYNIINQESEYCLAVTTNSNGSAVFQRECSGLNTQEFRVIDRGAGRSWLQSTYSNKCLQVRGHSMSDGTQITQWSCSDQDHFYFAVGNARPTLPDIDYVLRNTTDSSYQYLEPESWTSSGTPIERWSRRDYGTYWHVQHWRFEDLNNGFYRIRNRYSNLCLNVRGASMSEDAVIQQYPCGNHSNEQWRVVRFDDDSAALQARHSGMCAELPTGQGSDLRQRRCHGTAVQRFDIFETNWVQLAQGEFVIQTPASTSRCLEPESWGSPEGRAVVQRECLANHMVQRWHLEHVEDGSYRAIHDESGLCMGLDNSALDNKDFNNGVRVTLEPCIEVGDQQWYLSRVTPTSDTYTLRNRLTGRCLDLDSGSNGIGVAMQQWDCVDNVNQQFRLIRH